MMGENNIPVTPEMIEIEVDNIRMNSTGKLGVVDDGAKILPRYLRASIGSCHDLCKYGRKHDFETKAESPLPKRITGILCEGKYLQDTRTLAKKKKKPVIRDKPSPDSKAKTPDKPLVIWREVSSSTKKVCAKNDISLPGKGIDVSTKCANDSKLKPTKPFSFSATEHSSIKRNSDIRRSSLGGSSIFKDGEIRNRKEMGTSKMGEKEVLVPPAISSSPRPSAKRVPRENSGNYKNPKGTSHWKNRNNARKTEPGQASDEKVLEKTLYIEPEAENKTAGTAQNGTHTTQLSPSSKEKSLIRAHNSVQTTQSPPSSENKSLIRTRKGIHSTQSLLSSTSYSKSTLNIENGAISEHNETETKKQLANQKVEHKNGPRMCGITSSQSMGRKPWKMNFRRGKVVNFHTENNGSRRLRCRRGRVLGENQNGKDDAKRKYRWRHVVEGVLNANNTEPEKVVLRRHNFEGKKDTQSLFNNVIEETATKLSKARESKVKALVGAFETVISLQETRPSAETTT
ncbi:hypothetical protein L1049_028545 [Liquidambar formosana]|uniref:Calmodulin-binding domain-containing protein n=1 Tax=Liquidambar formosana TaxID=63359 RepID=A0AAP0WWQ7_LIQFO